MRQTLLVTAVLVCAYSLNAQVPKPQFAAQDAEAGKKLAAASVEIRAQIKEPQSPAEPFKMLGNLYFVGTQNGESYLLTSPQGHILMGAGYEASVETTQKNIEAMGFKMTDIKVILL